MYRTPKSWIKFIAILTLLLTTVALQIWQNSPSVIASEAQPPTDIWIVKFDHGLTPIEEETVVAEIGGVMVERIEQLHIAQIRFPASAGNSISASSVSTLLAEDPRIRFVEVINNASSNLVTGTYTPNDPAMADVEKAHPLTSTKVDLAWNYTTGDESIVIAFLDSGVDGSHSEFLGRIVGGYDFVNDDEDPTDDHGHGTHVAGILAANMDNAKGNVGVCPKCRIMPIKVLDETNSGTWFQIAEGVVYAVDHGARIVNLSLGSTQFSPTMEAAINYAAEHNVLVVAAAGNYGSNSAFYPAAYDNVLAVAAVAQNNKAWPLSNYGDYIDVAAPGQRIYSTARRADRQKDAYGFMSGTSMAAPIVSGLAGLLLSQEPTRTAHGIAQRIMATSDDLGHAGWDTTFGYGCINAYAAVSGIDSQAQNVAQRIDFLTLDIYLPLVRR